MCASVYMFKLKSSSDFSVRMKCHVPLLTGTVCAELDTYKIFVWGLLDQKEKGKKKLRSKNSKLGTMFFLANVSMMSTCLNKTSP